MPITQVGSTTTTGNAVQATSRAPAVPAGAQADDVAIVFLDLWNSATTVTPPTGFTQLYAVTGGTGVRNFCFWKRLTGSDTGTYSFSYTVTEWSNSSCSMFRGVVTTGDPVGANFSTAYVTSATFPSVSVSPSYTPGLVWHGYNDSGGTHTAPTGYTKVSDVDCGSSAIDLTGANLTASGATVTVSSAIHAALVALEPQGALEGGYLLQEDGTKLILEDASGFLIMEEPFPSTLDAAGQSDIVSATSGTATKLAPVSGTAAVTSAVTGSANVRTPATGTVPVVSATSGAPTARATASGTSVITSATTGTANVLTPASGTIPVVSTTSGAADIGGNLTVSGTTAITSATSGTANTLEPTSGTVAVASTASGAATLRAVASGTTAITSTSSGAPTVRAVAAGMVAIVSTTTGSVNVQSGGALAASGTVTVTTTSTGAASSRQTIAASVTVVSDSVGSVRQRLTVVGVVAAVTSTSGDVGQRLTTSAAVAIVATVTGAAGKTLPVVGVVAIVSTVSGTPQEGGWVGPVVPRVLVAVLRGDNLRAVLGNSGNYDSVIRESGRYEARLL